MTIRPYKHMHSSADVRTTADRLGSYFFSTETMRWFSSRLLDTCVPSPIPGEDQPEGTQVVYIITSDKTGFGDAPRGYRPRRVTVTRNYRESDHRIMDQIVFDPIIESDDEEYNGWFRTKIQAENAIALDITERLTVGQKIS